MIRAFPRRMTTLYTIPDVIRLDSRCRVAAMMNFGLYQDSAGTTPVTTNGDPVGRLSDQTPYGNHFTNGTSSQRMIYVASGHNGLPAIADDASNQKGLFGTYDFSGDCSIFVVYKAATLGNGRAIRGNPNNWLIGPRSSRASYYAGGFAGDVAYTANQAIIHYVEQTAAQGDHYVDGVIVPGGGIGSPSTPGTFSICSPGAGEYLNGQVQLVIGYSAKLNSTERKVVEAFIGSTFSISVPP